MIYLIRFTKQAEKEYYAWQTSDAKIFKEINALLTEIKHDPYVGNGNPEALKYELSGKWSRRINKKDRIVYQVVGEEVWVYQLKGHY